MVVYSEHRCPQAQWTMAQHWLRQSEAEAQAFTRLYRIAFACEADAQRARDLRIVHMLEKRPSAHDPFKTKKGR